MKSLRTTRPGPHIAEEDVVKFEQQYQLTLPELYRSFLLNSNGGRPERDLFPIQGLRGNPWGRIHFFFGLEHPIEAYRLDWNRDVIGSDTPPNLLFIATTEGADDICIDLNDGTVYYWDAYDEDDTGRRLYKIADSFEQLLELLYRDDLSPEMD